MGPGSVASLRQCHAACSSTGKSCVTASTGCRPKKSGDPAPAAVRPGESPAAGQAAYSPAVAGAAERATAPRSQSLERRLGWPRPARPGGRPGAARAREGACDPGAARVGNRRLYGMGGRVHRVHPPGNWPAELRPGAGSSGLPTAWPQKAAEEEARLLAGLCGRPEAKQPRRRTSTGSGFPCH